MKLVKHGLIQKIFEEYNMLKEAIDKIHDLILNNDSETVRNSKILNECQKIKMYREKHFGHLEDK